MMLGENWTDLMEYGHEASIIFVICSVIAIIYFYLKWKKKKKRHLR